MKQKKITLARKHKTRNLQSEKHQQFLKKQISDIEELTKKYPYLNLDEDIKYFREEIV